MRTAVKWAVGAALAAGCFFSPAGRAQDVLRDTGAVFVNLDRVFNEYYKTKIADAQLKTQAEEFNAERKKLIEELEKMQSAINSIRLDAQNKALSEEVRAKKRALVEEKMFEIREQESKVKRFDELRGRQLEDQSRRMRRTLVEEIREQIKNFARDRGYSAVVDSSGQSLNGVESVLYVDPRSDVTEKLLELLNKGNPAGEPAKGKK